MDCAGAILTVQVLRRSRRYAKRLSSLAELPDEREGER